MHSTVLRTSVDPVPETPVFVPDAESVPQSQALAADLVGLQRQEQQSRDRQRELELARQREVARFD